MLNYVHGKNYIGDEGKDSFKTGTIKFTLSCVSRGLGVEWNEMKLMAFKTAYQSMLLP